MSNPLSERILKMSTSATLAMAAKARELKEQGKSDARDFNQVTVLFTDFVAFTQLSEKLSAKELVNEINFYFKAFDNIVSKYKIEKRIQEVLEKVGMTHRLTAYPSSLSGGEKQRVAVARAIIHNPKVLFADEPTASLDSKRSKDTMALIQHVTKSLGMTTLTVTHDEEMLAYADRVVTMSDGKILKNHAAKSM